MWIAKSVVRTHMPRLPPLEPELRNKLIRMAWEDRTTFEEIERSLGCTEAQVIRIMRQELKPSSFRCWRKRVSGRQTKHQKKFRRAQKEVARHLDDESDRDVIHNEPVHNHRRSEKVT